MSIPQNVIADPKTRYGGRLSGTLNFITLRVTGFLNIFFAIFFIWLVVRLAGASLDQMDDLLANPVVAIVTALLIVSVAFHMRAGMTDIIEDYVHDPALERLSLLLNTLFALFIAVVTLAALFKLMFWG